MVLAFRYINNREDSRNPMHTGSQNPRITNHHPKPQVIIFYSNWQAQPKARDS